METAKKGDWVEIENILLEPYERASHIPEDTKATPLIMWVRGFLVNECAQIGDSVWVKTLAERTAEGTLISINPRHEHDFGNPVKELLEIGNELQKEIENLQLEGKQI